MRVRSGGAVLALLVILLVAIPLALPAAHSGGDRFRGTDGKAVDVIVRMRPDYKPWFHSLWSPPSAEVESLLFAIEAAGGAGLVGYALGFARGRTRLQEQERRHVPH